MALIFLIVFFVSSYRCATVCLSNKSLGYHQLEDAVYRSCKNEWRQLGPALLELIQVYLRVVAEAGWGTDGAHVYITWFRRLLKLLYFENKEMRTPVIHTLVALFERSVHVTTPNNNNNGTTTTSNNNVKYAYGGHERDGGKEKIRAQYLLSNIVASLGADVLLDLAEEYPLELRTNGHLLEESYLHMRPNMQSQAAVASIHKVARALALMSSNNNNGSGGSSNGAAGAGGSSSNSSSTGTSANSTLMIATQKLIFSATGRQDIRSILTSGGRRNSNGVNGFDTFVEFGENNTNNSGETGSNGSNNYCLGVILGTHLVGANDLSMEDVTTMSNWILRSVERVPRHNMVYAFDFFNYNCLKTSWRFAENVLNNLLNPLLYDLRLVGDQLPLPPEQPRWSRIYLENDTEDEDEARRQHQWENDLNVVHLATCRVTGDIGSDTAQRMVTLMSSCLWSTRTSLLLSKCKTEDSIITCI